MGGPVAWTGSARARWVVPVLVWLGIVGVVCVVALVLDDAGAASVFPVVVLAVAAVAVLAFRRIDVTVDDDAVRVRYSVPKTTTVPLAIVDRVEYLEDLRPGKWGGWGYRGARRVLKQAAIILRRGPAFLLHLNDGTSLAVTVDDAEGAVEAINRLLPPR